MLGNYHDIDENISFLKVSISFRLEYGLICIKNGLISIRASVSVPFSWRRFCESNLELLHFKQISWPSFIQSVDVVLFALVSKAFLAAAIPLSLSIVGYIFTTSKETKNILSVIISEFNSSIISSKWLVSIILV